MTAHLSAYTFLYCQTMHAALELNHDTGPFLNVTTLVHDGKTDLTEIRPR